MDSRKILEIYKRINDRNIKPVSAFPSIADIPPGALVLDSDGVVKEKVGDYLIPVPVTIIGSGPLESAPVASASNGLVYYDNTSGKMYMSRKKTCAFINQSAIPHYFCDSVGGDNLNDGLTSETPKQTVSAVKALALASCVIEFARGSCFREELSGLPVNCVVKAYGTGARPIFDCADVVTGFTKTGGYTNVYQKTFSNGLVVAEKAVISVWENSIRMKRVTSIALVDSTPNSFYGIGSGLGTDTFYFHSSDSSDPITNGKTYETSVRQFGVVASTGSELYGLHGQRNGHQYGSIIGSKYIKDCYAYDGNVHNMWNGGIAEDCECYVAEGGKYGSASMFVSYESAPSENTSILYERCIARGIENASAGWMRTGVTGYLAHTTGVNKFEKVSFIDCLAKDVQNGFTVQDTKRIVYSGCVVYNFLNAYVSFRSPDAKCTIYNCKALEYNGTSDRINTERAITCEGVELNINSCAIVMRRMIGGAIFSKTDSININGSSFNFGRSEINVALIYGDTTSGCPNAVSINKSIVYNAKKKYIDLRDTGLALQADNNSIDTELNGTVTINGVTYNSFADYRSALLQDANSIVGDPLFTGDVRNGDMSINAISPANTIGAGVTNYVTTNDDLYAGNVWDEL